MHYVRIRGARYRCKDENGELRSCVACDEPLEFLKRGDEFFNVHECPDQEDGELYDENEDSEDERMDRGFRMMSDDYEPGEDGPDDL